MNEHGMNHMIVTQHMTVTGGVRPVNLSLSHIQCDMISIQFCTSIYIFYICSVAALLAFASRCCTSSSSARYAVSQEDRKLSMADIQFTHIISCGQTERDRERDHQSTCTAVTVLYTDGWTHGVLDQNI